MAPEAFAQTHWAQELKRLAHEGTSTCIIITILISFNIERSWSPINYVLGSHFTGFHASINLQPLPCHLHPSS